MSRVVSPPKTKDNLLAFPRVTRLSNAAHWPPPGAALLRLLLQRALHHLHSERALTPPPPLPPAPPERDLLTLGRGSKTAAAAAVPFDLTSGPNVATDAEVLKEMLYLDAADAQPTPTRRLGWTHDLQQLGFLMAICLGFVLLEDWAFAAYFGPHEGASGSAAGVLANVGAVAGLVETTARALLAGSWPPLASLGSLPLARSSRHTPREEGAEEEKVRGEKEHQSAKERELQRQADASRQVLEKRDKEVQTQAAALEALRAQLRAAAQGHEAEAREAAARISQVCLKEPCITHKRALCRSQERLPDTCTAQLTEALSRSDDAARRLEAELAHVRRSAPASAATSLAWEAREGEGAGGGGGWGLESVVDVEEEPFEKCSWEVSALQYRVKELEEILGKYSTACQKHVSGSVNAVMRTEQRKRSTSMYERLLF